MIIFHDPLCETYQTLGHPESPARTRRTREHLEKACPQWEWRKPTPASQKAIKRAHEQEHIERLSVAADFDGDTAYHTGIKDHALRSAGAALHVVDEALAGKRAFSLMRPPGHHACRNRIMGFCYLNSVAIAALDTLERDGIERVAVYDFDAHHGNGTEDILLRNKRALFASAHEDGYPGTGRHTIDNCHNRMIPLGDHRTEHMAALKELWKIVLDFKPSLILLSAGFDAYIGDPITHMSLLQDDFEEFGRWVRVAQDKGTPVGAILEGGYSQELPELIEAFLKAWEGK